MISPVSSVAALLLAAGSSRRMGALNKLHLPIDGEPLIRRSLRTLLGSRIDHIVVVLGHEHEKTGALIEDLPVNKVINETYARGQMTSVNRGLDALGEDHDLILIALGDQPALESADIDQLIDCFPNLDGVEVLIPTYLGERGNPVIVSAAFRRLVLDDQRDLGCRALIDENPALVHRVEMSNPAFVADLDTPEQYADFVASVLRDTDELPEKRVS